MKRFQIRLAASAAAILVLCGAGVPSWAEEAAPGKSAEPTPAATVAPPSAAPAEAAKPAGAAKTAVPEAPVAVVNGKSIPKAEFDRAFSAYMQSVQRSNGGAMLNLPDEASGAMREEVITQLVDRELLYQESRKSPVEGLQQKVDEEIKGIQGRFPSPEMFQEALKGQDLTEADFKDLVGRQISVRNYVEKQIEPNAKVPDGEVKKFYDDNKQRFVTPEQVRASHLLLRVPEGAKPGDEAYKKAKAKAEELQTKAAGGEDFAKLCQENSEDPGSKDQGGDLGFFTRDRMVEPFASAAFGLKVAQVSGVVETQFGFHVIKLTERQDAVQHGFDEVKEDIATYLKGQALDGAVKAKLAELRKAATIEVTGSKK